MAAISTRKRGCRHRSVAGQPRQARLQVPPDLRWQRHPAAGHHLADKGYDSEAFRRACRDRGTEPIIPKRKTTGVKGLGKLRYVVEQSFALLHQFRRLAVRWERRLDIHDGFVSLAGALIYWRRLIKWTTG
jgi:transposase